MTVPAASTPKLVLAVDAFSKVKLLPLPTIKLLSVVAKPAMSAKFWLNACTFVPIVKPKVVLAVDALVSSTNDLPKVEIVVFEGTL